MSAYTLAAYVDDLRAIAGSTSDPGAIAGLVRPMARELALARSWLEKKHYVCDPTQGFGIHVLHEEPDHTLFVIAAAWLPGRGVAPHNHGTWAVVAGVEGPERNTFWRREDDGSRSGYARIVKVAEKDFGPGDVLTLLPDAIHSVRNETGAVTVSLHTYGYNLNMSGRLQFDPARDAVESVALTYER
jgi:predicted metal-dependent enzyme (double-stranded beta helix superfamily)